MNNPVDSAALPVNLPPPAPLTPEQRANQLAEVASFLIGVKGSLTDLKSKAVDGSTLRQVDNLDLKKIASELQGTPSSAPVNVPAAHIPVQQVPAPIQEDNNLQLTFQFDKKHTLEDLFNKVDDVYRKVLSLETEVNTIKNILEEKKSVL